MILCPFPAFCSFVTFLQVTILMVPPFGFHVLHLRVCDYCSISASVAQISLSKHRQLRSPLLVVGSAHSLKPNPCCAWQKCQLQIVFCLRKRPCKAQTWLLFSLTISTNRPPLSWMERDRLTERLNAELIETWRLELVLFKPKVVMCYA